MAQQNIDFGSFPDDPSADAIRTAFSKVQTNFDQLFGTNADSTVNSINRTPGAGITVNYPTGNVVISANIACLLVATTSLKVGRGADNTQSNVTITSSSQQLNIDIDPDQVLSNSFAAPGNNLATFNGTLTSNSYYQPNINTLGTLSSLDVSGNANFTGNVNFTGANINFANVSNLHIQGGDVGQYLQTDGAGNLSWAYGGGGGNGTPGGINTSVQFNDVGNFGANAGFTFNKTTGVLTAPSLNITNTAIIGNFLGSLSNGNSNVNIPAANGNVNISAEGNANVFIVTGVGANVVGNLNVDDKILANRLEVNLITGTLTTNAQPNVTSVGTLTSLNVTGNITGGNVYANSGTVGASLLTGTLTTSAQPNITTTGTLTSVSVSGNANVGNLNVANNVIVTGNLSVLGNATYINIESLVVEDPIISLGGGPNGDPLTSNDGKDRGTALQYYTTLPVTAFMGWDNSNAEFAFGSNVAIVSEVVTFTNYGNVRASYFISDNTQFGNANLGNTATANYFVGNFYGTSNSATTAGTVTTAAQPNITSVGVLTSLSVSGNATVGNLIGRVANGNSGITIAADSNISLTAVGNATSQLIVTGTGANVNGTLSVSGNSNVGNLGTTGVYATTLEGSLTTAAQPNVTSTGTLTSLSVSGNANIGNIGTAGVVTATGNVTGGNLVTTGVMSATGNLTAGNLVTGGVISASGNASVLGIKTDNYYYANGVAVSFAGTYGNSNVVSLLASFGSNTISTTGNANVGNLGTGGLITATGNIGGGNINTGGLVTATGNITSTAFLVGANLSVTGNANIGNIGTAGLITATGNVTGGNIVTGGIVSATGNVIASNVYANTGVVKGQYLYGDGSNISNLNIAAGSSIVNGTSNVSIPSSGGNVNTVVAGNTTVVVTGTGANISGTLSASGNANVSNLGTGRVIATGNISGTQLISNIATGTAPLVVTSTTTVANLAAATATTAGTVTTAAQGNITSVGTLTGLTVNGVSSLGDVANVRITGGNPIDVLVTVDGAGNLAWGTISFESIYNGTSNVFVTNNGNITMYVAGNANARFTATSTGVVANGTMSVSGTTTVGNLNTAGTVTASRLVSNIATGTAPFTVTSTTQVANLNAATAGTAGTVTTNAQPNITSVGTLTSLTVGGNVLPSANITYDLGSDTQRWKDIYLSNSTIYLGNSGATISANASAVVITNPGGISVPIKPGGANTQVQYNDDGIFGGNGGLTFDEGTTTLTANNLTVTNNFNASGYILRSVASAVTATGSTRLTSTVLTKQMNIVSTVSSGANGVSLPTAVAGMVVTVTNTTANALIVYPGVNGQINTLGANAGFTMGTTTIEFIAPTSTQWYTVGATYA